MRAPTSPIYTLLLVLVGGIGLAACGGSHLVIDLDDKAVHQTHSTPDGASPAAAVPASAGDVVLFGGGTGTNFASSAAVEIFKPATKTFVQTSAMGSARTGGQAVAFTAGPLAQNILVVGGMSGSANRNLAQNQLTLSASALDTAQHFKRSTGAFTITDAMSAKRVFHTATVLKNNKVLVTGGYTTGVPLKTAEIYDPATKMFTNTANTMVEPRAMHSATLLNDGKVLIVGGLTAASGATVGTAELYDPATNKFTKLAKTLPAQTLAAHTATLITGCGCALDGQVMIAGGFSGFSLFGAGATTTDSTAIFLYNPATKTFTKSARKLFDTRLFHTASLLAGGKVLFAGGIRGQAKFVNSTTISGLTGAVQNSAEIFDAKANTIACVGTPIGSPPHCPVAAGMKASRAGHTATVFKSGPLAGQVLLAGGFGRPNAPATSGTGNLLATAEIFNPATKVFALTGAMKASRAFHSAVLAP